LLEHLAFRMNRRTFFLAALSLPWGLSARANPPKTAQEAPPQARLAELEKTSGGRLGVYAIDTANGNRISHRADERFPLCSTFNLILASAVLARSTTSKGLLSRRVHYPRSSLVGYSPISERHVDQGMTIAELCGAAVQFSDNTASNLLLKAIGGPAGLTAYARSIGNRDFRLDRFETDLNTALPGDVRDTSTPAAMAQSLRALTLGDALPPALKKQLNAWLLGSTTGTRRIRAALPSSWQVGDKTGSGDYGTTNDLGTLGRRKGSPSSLPFITRKNTPMRNGARRCRVGSPHHRARLRPILRFD